MRHSKWLIAALFAIGSIAASGAKLDKEFEASLDVTGKIEIAADGRVVAHTIDHPEILDSRVVGLIDRTMAGWRFQSSPAEQSVNVSLRLRAKSDESDVYSISIISAHFERSGPVDESTGWGFIVATPPLYPRDELMGGVGGTVYLYILVDRSSGKPAKVFASEVDLDKHGRVFTMDDWRKDFAEAAVNQAMKWKFKLPAKLTADSDASRTVMVPVVFTVHVFPFGYGKWRGCIPGPHQAAPWLHTTEPASFKNPGALAANGIYPLDHNGPELMTLSTAE